MDTFLITGISGFVGYHFMEYLNSIDIDIRVIGVDVVEPRYDIQHYRRGLEVIDNVVDMSDYEQLLEVLDRYKPNKILHLASFSSVAYSWKNPIETFSNNTDIFLKMITAVWKSGQNPRILSVGSSEEYGNVSDETLIPIKEDTPLNPVSPYAIARVSQEMMSRLFARKYNMDVIMTRSFNHIGPGQDSRFAVPSFVERVLTQISEGREEIMLQTGDLSVVRDYVDVRDVVRAYYLLLESGKSGEIYNICTGQGIVLSKVIDLIGNELDVRIRTEINPEYLRPDDNRCIIGDPSKIEALGWKRKYSMNDSIRDIIRFQRT